MKPRNIMAALLGLALCVCAQAQQADYNGPVEEIDIVNWTHTDYGYTEHPLIVAELHKRFIDIALDAAAATKGNRPGERFTWTVEALDPLLHWWRETTPARRKLMAKAIAYGQIDVNIMPFNVHPGFDGSEMDRLMNWLPEDAAVKIRPTVAIQNDVNGFPRSAVSRALDRGVRYVWMGMNGRHPFAVPTLSWWEMPDGRKALLWSGVSYWAGYDFFHDTRWRTMQREAADLQYRWPRDGEFFRSDEASVRRAHAVCVGKLRELERKGFGLKLLPVTFANQWRFDNDGPYPAVVEFVKKWNELGLRPALRLSTATASMERLEKIAGAQAKTLRGEFGDWWAFGMSAMPRETAVARGARYMLKAALSPLFGPLTSKQETRKEEIERDVCTYYEHTFAAYDSGDNIYEIHNQGTMNEAFRYAYKAYEYARWMLAQRAPGAGRSRSRGCGGDEYPEGILFGLVPAGEGVAPRDEKCQVAAGYRNGCVRKAPCCWRRLLLLGGASAGRKRAALCAGYGGARTGCGGRRSRTENRCRGMAREHPLGGDGASVVRRRGAPAVCEPFRGGRLVGRNGPCRGTASPLRPG